MFRNIGKKMKVLAMVLCWLGIIASVLSAVAMFIRAEELWYGGDELRTAAIVTLIVGVLSSWISSWFLYGFGELVDKVCDIEKHLANGSLKSGAVPGAGTMQMVDVELKKKLDNLLAQGLITEEEYRRALYK